jgi:4-aminobutyrate--pyruvate transaminase
MSAKPNSIEARDIAYHADTSGRRHLEVGPLVIESGEGVYVTDNNGKRYIEGMAGLWSVGLGFAEKRLFDAASRQMAKLPFYHTFAHKSHGPVVELAEKLVTMAPAPMSKAFFANFGSEANDTAMKMIWYRSNALGQPQKKKIISRKRAYHGVTIASGSLTGFPNNHRSFDLPIQGVLHTACPHHWRDAEPGESEEAFATRLASELEALILAEGPETIAAFFGEPVMAAGGVVVPPRTYWAKIQDVLQKYDILLLADEVICGFGRTGKMFGCQTFDLKPDMIVFSKQLSSSYLPISAFLANDRVLDPILDESERIDTPRHGFAGGGHPVGAAVALETVKIIEERHLVDHAAEMGALLLAGLRQLGDCPLVGEVRSVGLIAAVELVVDKATKSALEPPGALGAMVNAELQVRGLISRAIGDAIAFCPPLIIQPYEVRAILDIFAGVLDAVSRNIFGEASGKVA